MKTLFTITGNLLAESAMTFDMPQEGQTARAKAECQTRFQVGGKGVNVARAAKAAGFNSLAVIFPAGHIGARCVDWLEADNGCDFAAEFISGETREGLVCINAANGLETTFLGADAPVDENAFAKAIATIEKKCRPHDAIAICGSFPGWRKQFAEAVNELCARKKLSLCLDTYGAPLVDLADAESEILKINRKEFFASLADESDDGRPETFERAFKNARKKCGAKIMCASDGPNPVLCFCGNDFFKTTPPKIDEVSATGCGDIMLAAIIVETIFKNTEARKAIGKACTWAAEAARHREINALPQKRIMQILKD